MSSLADLIPEEHRGTALSASELAAAQDQAEAIFPPDLCELLTTTLPTGPEFPDWRHQPGEEMRAWREWIVDGFHFDVINNGFWLPDWGERPDDPRDSRSLVAERLAEVPQLIRIAHHRGIPNEPLASDNPVFSVMQTDIIVYGINLADYLANEFHRDELQLLLNELQLDEFQRAEPQPADTERTIRFWSDLQDRGQPL
jgi:hypothetical protein